mmetsp:Transcript_6790/g.17822  ORF Transcript_6790/g.17822 Transcript_6790/m.17822 type:complete len:211 (-) Transcript_6790:156-788(-)
MLSNSLRSPSPGTDGPCSTTPRRACPAFEASWTTSPLVRRIRARARALRREQPYDDCRRRAHLGAPPPPRRNGSVFGARRASQYSGTPFFNVTMSFEFFVEIRNLQPSGSTWCRSFSACSRCILVLPRASRSIEHVGSYLACSTLNSTASAVRPSKSPSSLTYTLTMSSSSMSPKLSMLTVGMSPQPASTAMGLCSGFGAPDGTLSCQYV